MSSITGLGGLKARELPGEATIIGMIVLTPMVLSIGSASTKRVLLSLTMVPMLMAVCLSLGLTQAAFRVGDSYTNIIPY